MAAGQTVLQIPSAATGLTAKLHPTVLFNICDSYVRRNDQAERVIGTLLGSVTSDGTVDIRNSYCVPHNESSDQVFLSKLISMMLSPMLVQELGFVDYIGHYSMLLYASFTSNIFCSHRLQWI